MDFRLTEDQLALQEGIRSFCDGRVPFESLAALEKTPLDRDLWSELAEMGVFGLRLPESEGGVGLGMSEAVLVFAELGRRLVPGPLVWSHLAAALVEGAGAGSAIVGGLDRFVPSSEPALVEYLDGLDAVLLLSADGVRRVDARALVGTAVATPLDPLTPLHHVADLPAGEAIGDAAVAGKLRLEGAALAAAQLLGITEATLEFATDYAKKREQFGRPIGGFQAIKHILAECFVRQEQARAAVWAAGATLDDPSVGNPLRAVSTAKLVAGEAAMKNARACVQVYGGMGYTWEMPPHYYLKRTWVLESVFGTASDHAHQVATHL